MVWGRKGKEKGKKKKDKPETTAPKTEEHEMGQWNFLFPKITLTKRSFDRHGHLDHILTLGRCCILQRKCGNIFLYFYFFCILCFCNGICVQIV